MITPGAAERSDVPLPDGSFVKIPRDRKGHRPGSGNHVAMTRKSTRIALAMALLLAAGLLWLYIAVNFNGDGGTCTLHCD